MAQVSPGVPALPPYKNPPELGESGECVSEEENDVVLELNEPERMT